MKKIVILLSVIFSVYTLNSNAQDPDQAQKILDKLSAETKTYKTINAKFTFEMRNVEEDISDEYDGEIFMKGNMYKVLVMGAETYFDGTTMWTYMPDSEEVNIDEPDPDDEESLTPSNIFTIYEKGFKYAYFGEVVEGGKTLQIIDLYPQDRDKPYSRIRLSIDKNKNRINTITQVGKDGNNFTITVKSMSVNETMDDTMFSFDSAKHPNVDVIDMR